MQITPMTEDLARAITTDEPTKPPAEPVGARKGDELAELLARAPEPVRAEYESARAEVAAMARTLAAIASARSEGEVVQLARLLRGHLVPVGLRWLRARKGVVA